MNIMLAAKEAQETIDSHSQRIADKDAEINALRTELEGMVAFRIAMIERVSAVVKSGDPVQYEALAKEFLTPSEEKERLEKVARIEALKAEQAALEAELQTP